MRTRHWLLVAAATATAAVAAILFLPAAPQAEAQDKGFVYSYAAKFVCGFNSSNLGVGKPGEKGGEATVKLGNYATEINIYNPNSDTHVQKKLAVLYDSSTHYPPQGREPNVIDARVVDAIGLGNSQATMDDCNRIYQLFFGGLPGASPPPLLIGWLVIESQVPLNVTGVYTAELCSDWSIDGLTREWVCRQNADFADRHYGVGLSIDVEEVTGTRIGG